MPRQILRIEYGGFRVLSDDRHISLNWEVSTIHLHSFCFQVNDQRKWRHFARKLESARELTVSIRTQACRRARRNRGLIHDLNNPDSNGNGSRDSTESKDSSKRI